MQQCSSKWYRVLRAAGRALSLVAGNAGSRHCSEASPRHFGSSASGAQDGAEGRSTADCRLLVYRQP